MKKCTLLILLFIIQAVSFSQTTTTENLKHTFQVGLIFSPDYCNATNAAPLATEKNLYRPKVGYTGGLNICYNINRIFAVEFGVQYSNKGYVAPYYNLQTLDDLSTSKITKAGLQYNYFYMDIPLKVNITLGKKKLRFITSAGVTTNLFILGVDNCKSVNISPVLSAGIDYKISKLMHLRLEPTLRYGLLNTSYDTYTSTYFFNAGFNIGVYFKVP